MYTYSVSFVICDYFLKIDFSTVTAIRVETE